MTKPRRPSRESRAPIRLTLLTGFLGAGKTTVLNRLLSEPSVTDTAVVVNEFGEVGIDQMLVEAEVSDGLIELSDGCLCCSVRGELVETLERLALRTKDGRPLSRVIVETTGLADPTPILAAIMTHPVLASAYALDAVICVVDAVNGEANLFEQVEAARQIAVADRILLSKSDLVPGGGAELGGAIRAVNAHADILALNEADTLADRILDCGLSKMDGTLGDPAEWLGRDHAGEADHEHHHNHHRHGSVRSMALVHDAPIPQQAVFAFLEMLGSFEGGKILRMKGVVLTTEHLDQPLVLHGVRGYLHPPARLPSWREGARRQSRLVIIGDHLNEDRVRDLFAAFTGGVRADAPDRTAIEDNPLAVPGMSFS
ncbi:GTP-binding protein [Fulvimarina sp. MAC3]|uniref:CobW family GTP-binding protein n=1 Tax=Fulvimarina sp. MAC3 TaxID=3148887 RepID=UPI0031FD183E